MRQNIIRVAVASFLAFSAFTAQAQVAHRDLSFHDRVIQTYNFDPKSNAVEEVAAKAHAMDGFWSYVTANRDQGLPLLRAELVSGNHPSFFSYDGAKLLMALSKDRADLQLAANSIASVSVSDIEHNDYFRTAHDLGVKGVDITPLALKILDEPKFWISVGSGSRPIPQAYALAMLLFQMPEKNFLKQLIERLRTETAVESQMSILFALWCTATPEAKAAIANFATDGSKPKEAQDFVAKLQKLQKPQSGGALLPFLFSVEGVKEDRRRGLANIDETTIPQFNKYTAKIMMLQK